VLFLFIVDRHIAVSNMKPFSVAMETKGWFSFAQSSTRKTFQFAINGVNALGALCQLSEIVRFLNKFGVSRQIFLKVLDIKFHGNLSSGSRADACGQTDRNEEADRHFSLLFRRNLKISLSFHMVFMCFV
jgi:hypothetical protein